MIDIVDVDVEYSTLPQTVPTEEDTYLLSMLKVSVGTVPTVRVPLHGLTGQSLPCIKLDRIGTAWKVKTPCCCCTYILYLPNVYVVRQRKLWVGVRVVSHTPH